LPLSYCATSIFDSFSASRPFPIDGGTGGDTTPLASFPKTEPYQPLPDRSRLNSSKQTFRREEPLACH
jgi:hypothetical protein